MVSVSLMLFLMMEEKLLRTLSPISCPKRSLTSLKLSISMIISAPFFLTHSLEILSVPRVLFSKPVRLSNVASSVRDSIVFLFIMVFSIRITMTSLLKGLCIKSEAPSSSPFCSTALSFSPVKKITGICGFDSFSSSSRNAC